jgi:heme A synthase
VLGAATGIGPPPWAQAGNLIGGLLLAALLAVLLGSGKRRFRPYLLLGVAQVLLGAWIAIFAEDLFTPVLLTHALLGLGLAAAAAWVFLRLRKPLQRVAAVLLALAVPVSGAASVLLGLPFAAMLAHSTSVALLVCAAAYSHAALLDPHQGAAGADLRR